jgi:hypothetical protein
LLLKQPWRLPVAVSAESLLTVGEGFSTLLVVAVACIGATLETTTLAVKVPVDQVSSAPWSIRVCH